MYAAACPLCCICPATHSTICGLLSPTGHKEIKDINFFEGFNILTKINLKTSELWLVCMLCKEEQPGIVLKGQAWRSRSLEKAHSTIVLLNNIVSLCYFCFIIGALEPIAFIHGVWVNKMKVLRRSESSRNVIFLYTVFYNDCCGGQNWLIPVNLFLLASSSGYMPIMIIINPIQNIYITCIYLICS